MHKLGEFIHLNNKLILGIAWLSKQTSDILKKFERSFQLKFGENFWLPDI